MHAVASSHQAQPSIMSQEESTYCELQSSTLECADNYEMPITAAVQPKPPYQKTEKSTQIIKILIIATVVNVILSMIIATPVLIFGFLLQNQFSNSSSESGVAANGGGAIYTRWGKSSCPDTEGTELLYNGTTGGSAWGEKGGGANHLCLPNTPEYSPNITYRNTDVDGHAFLWPAQYESPVLGSHGHNVPCAVCYVSTRPTVVMIPAKASCPPTWTKEYYGYIMAARSAANYRATFECVDASQESLCFNSWGATFFHVEAQCGTGGGLPCPPYKNTQQINCVVCSN